MEVPSAMIPTEECLDKDYNPMVAMVNLHSGGYYHLGNISRDYGIRKWFQEYAPSPDLNPLDHHWTARFDLFLGEFIPLWKPNETKHTAR